MIARYAAALMLAIAAPAAAQLNCREVPTAYGWVLQCQQPRPVAPAMPDMLAMQGGVDNLPTALNGIRAAQDMQLRQAQIDLMRAQAEAARYGAPR